MTLNNSTVTNNTADTGGGIFGGDDLILNNTIKRNEATNTEPDTAGGIYFWVLVLNNSTSLRIVILVSTFSTESTLSDTVVSANLGHGIVTHYSTATMNHATISDNGGVGLRTSGAIALNNSRVSSNRGGGILMGMVP